jgi:hypothetical protein
VLQRIAKVAPTDDARIAGVLASAWGDRFALARLPDAPDSDARCAAWAALCVLRVQDDGGAWLADPSQAAAAAAAALAEMSPSSPLVLASQVCRLLLGGPTGADAAAQHLVASAQLLDGTPASETLATALLDAILEGPFSPSLAGAVTTVASLASAAREAALGRASGPLREALERASRLSSDSPRGIDGMVAVPALHSDGLAGEGLGAGGGGVGSGGSGPARRLVFDASRFKKTSGGR